MASPTYLAVDVMGGDESPHLFVSAAVSFLQQNPLVHIALYGDSAVLQAALNSLDTRALDARLTLHFAEQTVAPDEKPVAAIRHKQQSSMWLAISAVARGDAQGVLSAGNTGALMVMARHLLGGVEGIERPAICKKMPIESSACYVLDLGANLIANAKQLHGFALMGAALAGVEGLSPARVGLLNVGQEHHKGTEALQEADKQLRLDSRFNYVGFVEGNAFFNGSVNVVVCDGFTGNVALKASEGLARFLIADLKSYFNKHWWLKCLGFIVGLIVSAWFKRLDPAAYNGALLMGLNGVVVKSHGGANGKAFNAALRVAAEQAQRRPDLLLKRWLAQ